MTTDEQEQRKTRTEFNEAVNMTASELKDWLGSRESRSTGDTGGHGESTGHEMGRHIVGPLSTKAVDLGEQDVQRMRKVVGYVHRHLAQRRRATSRTPSGATRS